MQAHFSSVTIEGYRGIKKLEIAGLGQVNLITGRNNTGKSSVLEALRILAANGSSTILSSILRERDEEFGESDGQDEIASTERPPQVKPLFYGYPPLTEVVDPIHISGKGLEKNFGVTINVSLMSELAGTNVLLSPGTEIYSNTQELRVLLISSNGARRAFRVDQHNRVRESRKLLHDEKITTDLPCAHIRPFAYEREANLGALWDNIALTEAEKTVVDLLSKIAPDIKQVSMVVDGSLSKRRIVKVRSTQFPQPVPLRSYGDGVVRLFGIILSLVNAKDGLLLIDEFENGLHHSVQFEVWKGLFEIARRLNIQVFATSHSWDAVEAFQEAAHAFESDAALIRLTRKGEEIIPTLFSKEELAIATRDHIEVR